jgi:hypothetical protein
MWFLGQTLCNVVTCKTQYPHPAQQQKNLKSKNHVIQGCWKWKEMCGMPESAQKKSDNVTVEYIGRVHTKGC